MKLFGALARILGAALSYAVGGMLYSFVYGLLIGGVIGGVAGLFFTRAEPFGGAFLLGMVGMVVGFFAFAIAGVLQGAAAEFDFKNRMSADRRMEKCLDAAVLAGGVCALGGAVSGALVGVLLESIANGSLRGATLGVTGAGTVILGSRTFQSAALLVAAVGYAFGLFLGAIAPDAVLKARERWREWRRDARKK